LRFETVTLERIVDRPIRRSAKQGRPSQPVESHNSPTAGLEQTAIAARTTLLVSAQLRCAVRGVAITAAERNEVFCVASFRIVPGRQKPAFGVGALSRLVQSAMAC